MMIWTNDDMGSSILNLFHLDSCIHPPFLPPSHRQDVDKDVRVGVLRTALGGGSADLPGCDVDGLATASSQFIEDMEDQDVVIDRCEQPAV